MPGKSRRDRKEDHGTHDPLVRPGDGVLQHPRSLLRLLWKDHLALGSAILAGTVSPVWLTLLLVADWKEGDSALSSVLGGTAVLTTVVCGGWALRRLCILRRLLTHGAAVTGRILAVQSNCEDIWSATFGYTFGGREYRGKNVTGSDPGYRAGEAITLLVDPGKPSRAVIRDLYAPDAGRSPGQPCR
jgi:hypothetical protein